METIISTQNAGAAHIPTIGKKLFRLARAWATGKELPGTQKDREEQIKGCKGRKQQINGSRAIKAARAAVEQAALDIISARKQRNRVRIVAHLGYTPSHFSGQTLIGWRHPVHGTPSGRRVKVRRGTPADRLPALVAKGLSAELDGLRFDDTPDIEITRDPARVGVSQSETLDWDYYAKSCKYPKKRVFTRITVPAAWRLRVLRQGLADLDGLITLDAAPMECTGAELFAAVWLQQGRGYALSSVRGYIARRDDISYHGETAAAAVAGLNRKLKAEARAAEDAAQAASLAALVDREGLAAVVARSPGLTVSVSDAKAIGACSYGIESWCYRTGLDYDAGTATLAEVFAAYQAEPNHWARAAILQALKRQRRAVLSVA